MTEEEIGALSTTINMKPGELYFAIMCVKTVAVPLMPDAMRPFVLFFPFDTIPAIAIVRASKAFSRGN
jgi:hypothetical protein